MEGALGIGLDVVDTAARLHRAGKVALRLHERFLEQRVVSCDGKPVASVQRRPISVQGKLTLRSVQPGDVFVIPGIIATKDSSVQRILAREDVKHVVSLLPRLMEKGAMIAASCSATFLLGASGILDGKTATTTWWLTPSFIQRFPRVALTADRMVVQHGNIITAGSAFAHADLMLALITKIASPSLAHLVAKYLVLDTRESHSRYMVMEHIRGFDPLLTQVEEFVVTHVDRQISLAELAAAVRTSSRTLARCLERSTGMTPMEFVQRIRVTHAMHLLETTRESIEEVAARVGYADAAAFRRTFRRHAGTAPRDVRLKVSNPVVK